MPIRSNVRRHSRRIAAAVGAAAVGLGLLATPSTAQAADSSWSITYVRQPPICIPSSGYGDVYVLFDVAGSWDSAITYGLSDLPGDTWMQGGTFASDADPNPPSGLAQWRDDSYVAPGDYTLTLWATDGTVTHTAPVYVTVSDDC